MRTFVVLLSLAGMVAARADCVGERWPVKVAADADAASIITAPMPTTIAVLRSLPATRPLPQDRRVRPLETTTYSLTATIVEYRIESDGDAYVILADESGRTLVAELPAEPCSSDSRFAAQLASVRHAFDVRFAATPFFQSTRTPVEIRGVGHYDFLHSQRGMAANGIELHPVTFLSFNPLVPAPLPPKPPSRRRSVAPTLPACRVPSLTMNASKSSVCAGEPISLTWSSSDPAARVTIDGLGTTFAATGSTTVTSTASNAYSGHATNACGVSDEAVATVTARVTSSASLSGPGSLQRGNTATLVFSIDGTSSWSLTSSLRNPLSPSSGNTSGTFSSTYTASSSGTDNVTLTGTGACGAITRSITISISEPQNTGLQCCDGTRSPSCFSCSNKQGCCSGHKGVCGCQ
jgi:hypothetical protein